METIAYTVSGITTEVSLNALGADLHLKVELSTHEESKCTINLATLPPEIIPPIPFEAPCTIYTGRSGNGGSWSGGSILFQGRRTDNSGQASADGASQQLTIEDAWYDLRFITYQCAWQNIVGYLTTTPTYGPVFTWPDCVLFQSAPNGQLKPDGTFGTYSPAPLNGHITTGQTVAEILAYAIHFGGVNLQIGQLDPACYVPFYPVRSMRCADALKMSLRVHPDCACEIDYTTTPPTFNLRQRANLTSITLPYKSSSSSSSSSKQTHLSSKPHPRPDLIPSRVGIYVKETTTINGNDVVNVLTDIYPSGLPSGLRSLDASLDMNGPKLAKTTATLTTAALTTAALDPTALAWWAQKIPALKPLWLGGQIPNSGPGALALLDTTINSGHAKGLTVADNSGNPIDLANDPYELLTGTPASWMQLPGGGAVNVIEATVTGFFSYNKITALGTTSTNLTDVMTEHMHSVRIKLTNTPSATFQLSQILNTGEAYPAGLAQNIYASLATLQYDFSHTILESPFATVIKPGKHALNLSGGSSAWTAMNAMVQAVELDLMFTPGSNVTTARTTVNCGPVKHLEAGELVQLFNLFANRDLSKINPAERSGGASMSGGQITLGSDSPKENSSPAQGVPGKQNISAPDAVTGTFTNVHTSDPSHQVITFTQYKTDGSVNTAINHPRAFSGSGAPAAATLINGLQYQAGTDFYYDATTPSAPVGYLCTTTGSYNVGSMGGSVWAKITSSGFPWQTPKKELDPTVAVTAGTAVYVSPNNSLVTTGLVDVVSNQPTTSRPGVWLSLQNIPVKTGGGKYNVPQVPYPSNGGSVGGSPLAGDGDATNLYWILLGPNPYC